jgi:hypothetical protein
MRRLLVLLAACSSVPRVPAARFANAPIVVAVNDRLDVPKPPHERMFFEDVYQYDGLVQRRLVRALSLPAPSRAVGTNALDEVPDSTWFTNRIGTHDMTADEIVRGPNTIESPEHHKPWTITSTKTGGAEIGFRITDARGEKFVLKFDTQSFAEQETGAHVIAEKLLWACGFNVTEDYIVYFRDDDLVLANNAYIKESAVGERRPLDRAELERRLAKIERRPDGTYRGLASRWLAGKPLGGHPAEGVRADDPNDRIPHELRRELRGFYTFAAWLDHGDIQESNFLDMWTADRADPNRHYVVHYLLDFGKSLGVFATTGKDPRRGYEYWWDALPSLTSLVTFGLYRRDWEDRHHSRVRGVGAYDVASFEPDGWHATSAAYVPFTTRDRFDAFWATKILMRFTREQLRAVVDSAHYSDPRAAAYLTDTLVARQRATGAYWFARVNPLDQFTVDGNAVCFDDLALRYRFTTAATSYAVTTFDRAGRPLANAQVAASGAHTCTAPITAASDADGYTIVELATRRADYAGRTLVHVARDRASGQLRVIGIWRP